MDDATPLMVPNATVGDCVTDHDMTCAPGRTPRPSRWEPPLRALSVRGLLRKLNLGTNHSQTQPESLGKTAWWELKTILDVILNVI